LRYGNFGGGVSLSRNTFRFRYVLACFVTLVTVRTRVFGQRVERLVERLFKRNQSGPTDNSVLDLDGRVAQLGFESCFIKRKAGKGLP
jgi:hypothetical protein